MIKNRLSTVMGNKRMKPQEIVTLTGISRKTIYNIYNDKTKGIEFDTLDKLCFALDCTPNDLFRYIPDDK
ncbi:predicted protein [Clostridium sp. CAG:967]|nr:predicted protein [Clostridium sp. CAG:967]